MQELKTSLEAVDCLELEPVSFREVDSCFFELSLKFGQTFLGEGLHCEDQGSKPVHCEVVALVDDEAPLELLDQILHDEVCSLHKEEAPSSGCFSKNDSHSFSVTGKWEIEKNLKIENLANFGDFQGDPSLVSFF